MSFLILPDKYRTREKNRLGEKQRIEVLIKRIFCEFYVSDFERDTSMQELNGLCEDQEMADFARSKIKEHAGHLLSKKDKGLLNIS